jgi:UDPglucose--hexose-1-phosphate uridylyltransferase
MSDLVRDNLHDRTVISAANRSERPFDTISSSRLEKNLQNSTLTGCPFCAGHEAETPPEVLAIRLSDSPANSSDWRVRLVPNRYPAVDRGTDAALSEAAIPSESNTALNLEQSPAIGDHDVLICAPAHKISATELTDDDWTDVFSIALRRMQSWREEKLWHWATLFQNVGAAAGASLEHIHCQMLALPTVPALPSLELESSAAYHFTHNRCYWCDELAAARNSPSSIEKTFVTAPVQSRLVIESEKHAAFCPVASRLPYEVWILPKRHNSHFELTTQEDLADLAKLLRSVLVKLEHLQPSVAYNWWLHSAPFHEAELNDRSAFDSDSINHYHWHIEVVPRIATTAGFEWCSGWHINSVPADQAAAKLRSIDL